MRLHELSREIRAEALLGEEIPSAPDPEIKRVYAADRISDLLSQGDPGTLLVTNLAGAQILRVAQLMDVPAICLLNGIAPEPELIGAAGTHGTVLLVSPFGMFETCGRLYQCFSAPRNVDP